MAATLTPMVYAVPVTVLAYHTAVSCTDVDTARKYGEIGDGE